jgi:hypothetical protein
MPQMHNILHVISSFNNYYSLAQAIALLLHDGLSCTLIAYCLIALGGENGASTIFLLYWLATLLSLLRTIPQLRHAGFAKCAEVGISCAFIPVWGGDYRRILPVTTMIYLTNFTLSSTELHLT